MPQVLPAFGLTWVTDGQKEMMYVSFMPHGLRRYHHSGQSHFVTFSCYRRRQNFTSSALYDLFLSSLEQMRRRFAMRVYGYVIMPEHVHLSI